MFNMLASISLLIVLSFSSFMSYSDFESKIGAEVKIQASEIEAVNSCTENLSSEYLGSLNLSEDPGILLQYYFWPTSFCVGSCGGMICCEVVIVIPVD